MAEKIRESVDEGIQAYYKAIEPFEPRTRCILLLALARDMIAAVNGQPVKREFEEAPSLFQ